MRPAQPRRTVRVMIQRWRRWWDSETRAVVLDVLLAWSIGALALFELLRVSANTGEPVPLGAVALLLVQSVALTFRRWRPMLIYAVVGFGTIAYAWLGYPSNVAGLGVLVAIYTVAAHEPLSDAVAAAAIYIGGMFLSLLGAYQRAGATPDEFLAEFLVNLLALVLAWTVGVTIRTRRAYVAALEARNSLLEREREDNARLAVALERGRIARELHDVVAHSVSVVVVQADGAERLVETDPARAREALRDIAATGRQALAEMRRLLGVLREAEPDHARAPQPGIAELRSLAARVEDAGLPVELSVQGDERPLPASAALSAYRIVQEALTNTLRHAGPARARVILRYLPDALEVQVSDNGAGQQPGPERGNTTPADGGGHGLIGMRERVTLFGGELHAGPRPEGGYAVVARIPTSAAEP
jgi:signal transduction histidine kinase